MLVTDAMIPRELNPEFYWRVRLWMAGWKVILLFVTGVLWGATIMGAQMYWPKGPAGIFLCMFMTFVFIATFALAILPAARK